MFHVTLNSVQKGLQIYVLNFRPHSLSEFMTSCKSFYDLKFTGFSGFNSFLYCQIRVNLSHIRAKRVCVSSTIIGKGEVIASRASCFKVTNDVSRYFYSFLTQVWTKISPEELRVVSCSTNSCLEHLSSK